MLRGIDHLVIAVRDLDTAVKDYRALGFTVVPGGRHPAAVGTHNALIAFQDGAYLELIAFYAPNTGHRWWAPLERGGGLVDFCVQTDDLAGDTAAFRAAGVEIADPVPQARTRPDGYELHWVFSLAQGAHRGVAPFIIQDRTPRDERVPRERAHPNGVAGIAGVTVAVEALAPVRDWYARALGRPGEDGRRDDLPAAAVRFALGPHTLELAAPERGRGPLPAWLAARGASPYAATLRSTTGQTGRLDERKTGGARLFLA